MKKTPTRPDPEELIGTRKAAAIAGVAQNTVNHWIRTGKLKKVRMTPSGYRFPAAQVYRLLEGSELIVETRKIWRSRKPRRKAS